MQHWQESLQQPVAVVGWVKYNAPVPSDDLLQISVPFALQLYTLFTKPSKDSKESHFLFMLLFVVSVVH